MPTGPPVEKSQTTLPAPGRPLSGSPPQQSASFRQRSPVTWQPLAGWQIARPLGPGAQTRLQQSLQPPHTSPSTPPQRLGPEGGCAQTPTLAPEALVQVALQQS